MTINSVNGNTGPNVVLAASDVGAAPASPQVPTHSSATRNSAKVLGEAMVYPEEFGAAGDGTTDDTSAINAALAFAKANGLALGFLPRTYRFTGSLAVDPSLRSILGAGAGLEGANAAGPAIMFAAGNYTNTVYDLPNVYDYSGAAVKAYGACFLTVRQSLIQNLRRWHLVAGGRYSEEHDQ